MAIPESGIVSFVIGLCVVGLYLFGFEQVAYAQDVAGSAVDLKNSGYASLFNNPIVVYSHNVDFYTGDDLSDDPFYTLCHCIFHDASGHRIATGSPNQVLIGLSLFCR